MSKEWINDVGTINESKDKSKLYIKIDKDIVLKAGDTLVMKKKADEIKASVEAGRITEERGEELLAKLHFIKYSLHKPPANSGN